jgi:hypothetical protein
VPAGAIDLTGQGTNTISFTYAAGFTNGSISVTASNGCAISGVRTLSVTKLNPATPSVIDVIQVQSCPNRVFSYTLSAMPANANSILWTIPTAPGVVIVSGQGTTSIQVSYPADAIQGTVTAQSISNCGASTIRQSAVKLPACPPVFAGKSGETQPAKENVKIDASTSLFDVQVYPNPTTSEFSLLIKAVDQTKVMVRIFDLQGRQLKTIQVMSNEISRIGNDLKAGVYLLEITEGKNKLVKKIIKQ